MIAALHLLSVLHFLLLGPLSILEASQVKLMVVLRFLETWQHLRLQHLLPALLSLSLHYI